MTKLPNNALQVLTGREMLTLFARIRGLRSKDNIITNEIEKLANFVDLTQYLDRPCGQYSGGNKRKLNVALALIGRPKVYILTNVKVNFAEYSQLGDAPG